MKLTELDPSFLVIQADGTWRQTAQIEGADGVYFLCPKCFVANGGPVGTHRVLCWQPHVPQTVGPTPGRWNLVGTGFHDLSLVAGSSSVQLLGGCNWHGFITNGEVTGA